jgi:hypothetical protein
MGILNDVLSGLGWIWDQTAGRATTAAWDQLVTGLVSWVLNSISWFVSAILQFFQRSSTPDLGSAWFAGGPLGAGAHSPYGVVASLAISVLLLCVLLSVVHGLILGEGPALLARLVRDLPLAILGIVATIGVVQVLLGAADELSKQVLSRTDAGAHATQVLRTLESAGAFSGQPTFVVFLLGVVAVLAAFLLWVELLIRASLLYVMVALSPLAYAAFVWPTARRVVQRLAELIVALIASKVVIAITLAVAASALVANPNDGVVPAGEAKLGTLLVGTILFLLGAFSPFLVLRLFSLTETAVVARGISRGPARTTQTAMLTALTVSRLAGAAGTTGAPAATKSSAPSTASSRPALDGAGTQAPRTTKSSTTSPQAPHARLELPLPNPSRDRPGDERLPPRGSGGGSGGERG